MISFLVVIAGLGWSLFLIQRYRDLAKMPELFAPVTDEERKAREDAAILKSKLDDALTRLKHAEQDAVRAKRDAKALADENAELVATVWSVRRALDNHPVPVLTGDEERAG